MECGFLDDLSVVITTQNAYFYEYTLNEHDKAILLNEHTLKRNDIDIKHQHTKIFRIEHEHEHHHDGQQQTQCQKAHEQQHKVSASKLVHGNEYEEENELEESKDELNCEMQGNEQIASPPDSPASESPPPEIFNTHYYQDMMNENDNFKLDLDANYT